MKIWNCLLILQKKVQSFRALILELCLGSEKHFDDILIGFYFVQALWSWISRRSCQALKGWSHTPTAGGVIKGTWRWTWSALPWETSATPCTLDVEGMSLGTHPFWATTVGRPMGTMGRRIRSPHLTTRSAPSSPGRFVTSGEAQTTDPEREQRICPRRLLLFLPSSRTPSPSPGWT